MKVIALLMTIFFILGCSSDSEFTQTNCEYLTKDTLIVSFSSDIARRTVSIGVETLKFKGTTLKDMKWLTELKDIKSVEFEKGDLFILNLDSGFSKRVGIVNGECKSLISRHLKKYGVVL